MSRRLTTVMSAGVVFAVSLLMGAAALAQEDRAGEARLTPEQREQFVEGAREVAGLSDEEIRAALRDPGSIAAVPVREEVRPPKIVPLNSVPAGQRGAAGGRCKAMAGISALFNVYREELFAFQSRKEWCYNAYNAVTYAPPATVAQRVTPEGRKRGWRYVRLVEMTDGFVTYDGLRRGAHASKRAGWFRTCREATGCINRYPRVKSWVFYDGNAYQRTAILAQRP